MPQRHISSLLALAAGAALLAGCSTLGDPITTASLPEAPKVDPACVSLTAQIDGLRKEGIADKIEKAATKKYKMKPAELTKADQLTKANAEFQMKCSSLTPKAPAAQTAAVAPQVTASSAPVTQFTAPNPDGQ